MDNHDPLFILHPLWSCSCPHSLHYDLLCYRDTISVLWILTVSGIRPGQSLPSPVWLSQQPLHCLSCLTVVAVPLLIHLQHLIMLLSYLKHRKFTTGPSISSTHCSMPALCLFPAFLWDHSLHSSHGISKVASLGSQMSVS